jgi:fibronectin-binding autotransporter adhesin
MSKKLNHSLAIGIFLIGIFSASVSQAQIYTNLYWNPSALGGTGQWNQTNAFWSTNPAGGGTLQAPLASTSNIYNFSGTAGTVSSSSSLTVGGINWSTTGYNLNGTSTGFKYTGTDSTLTGTNTVSIANDANLNITGTGGTFDALGMTGGAGSTVTLTNAAGVTTTVIFGSSSAKSGRTNSVNTIISGAGTVVLGSQGNNGFTQAGTIVNNSSGSFVITNSASGNVNLNGVVSGTSGLTLVNSSSGSILLAGSNSYAGGTLVNTTGTGQVRYGDSKSFGTGGITIADGATSYLRANVNGLDVTNNVMIGTGSTLRASTTNSSHKTTWSGEIGGAGGILYNYSDSGLYLTGTNSSFGNGVNLGSSGSLYVSKLGMAGANSSIGTNGAITISATTANPSLRWTGTGTETSDKTIVLSATSGINVIADGAANSQLILNGDISTTGSGARTLGFSGRSTNTLTINGLISENINSTNSVAIGGTSSGTVVLANTNNSFSGAVSITNQTSGQNTVLSVAKIGNAGDNSALGKNGTINVGSSSSGAGTALKYTGTGETSDKVINFTSATGGLTLDQSGTGNFKLNNAFTASVTGAKKIELAGSSAGTGELGGGISDLGGVTSLSKSGTGTWKLSGNNSYSGTTEFKAAGILQVASTNSLSKNSSLLGASSSANTGTLDLLDSGDYLMNSYGTSATGGFNMKFTNSSGSAATLRFTNAENYITIASNNSGGRSLENQSSLLDVRFDGNLEIGSTTVTNAVIELGGAGNFRVDGAIRNSGISVRGLVKTGAGTLTLAGTNNSYNGATAVNGGTLLLTNSATLTGSTALTVSTSNTVSSSSATRTAAATLNLASGSTLLSNSITTVYSGGNLIVNGTAGSVVVENNGLLGGSGTNNGVVTLKTGSFLNPGNSPGTLTASSATWAAGSTYNWEIDQAGGGTAGVNWDLFSVVGALDLSALSSNAKMNLVLNSLSSMDDFFTTSSYSWVIAQAGSFTGTGLTNGANVTDLFNINTTAFNGGAQLPSYFKVEVGETTVGGSTLQTLNLMTIPEPSTGSMFGLGLAGLVVTRLLRRKNS